MLKGYTSKWIILLLLFVCSNGTHLLAQKARASHWFFGDHYGLDFSEGIPQADFSSSIYTYESCTTMSDKNGELLFYTNGGGRANQAICGHIWNRNHEVMEGGNLGYDLGGGYSAAQGAIAFEKPGTENVYYLFTVDESETLPNNNFPKGKGANYFEIDMNANGGLGAVTLSNQPLVSPAFEYQAATIHDNCEDYWLIVPTGHYHVLDDPAAMDSFYVYLVNNNGPTLAHQIPIPEGYQELYDEYGIIKISPDGKLITAGGFMYDFDNSTGMIEFREEIQMTIGVTTEAAVAFSPDANYLYKFVLKDPTILPLNDTSSIFQISQYDLRTPNLSDSAKLLLSTELIEYAVMGTPQLGPDGKLYFLFQNGTYSSPTTLAVINYPNEMGEAADIDLDFMTLSNLPDTRFLRFGNFTDHLFYNEATLDNGENETITMDCQLATELTLTAPPEMDCYYWSNGATTSAITTTEAGFYWVEYIKDCEIGADSFFINHENDLFAVDLGDDFTLCDDEEILLVAPSLPMMEYLWQDNSTTTTFLATAAGSYYVSLQQGQCISRDTIVISYNEAPVLSLGEDLQLCIGEEFILNITNPEWNSYTWQDGSNLANYTIVESGIYELVVANECGSAMDEVEVFYTPCDTSVFCTLCETEESCPIYIPNAFSPDGSFYNDLFQVFTDCDVSGFHLQIFDRWGNQVFGSQQIDTPWNGTLKGQLCQTGVYVYKLNYKWLTVNGEWLSEESYGELLLLR